MRTLIGLMVMLMLVGSIPFFVGDPGARGERSDYQMGSPPARGNTIIVDINGTGDYLTINTAILNSKEGDVIKIKEGVYNESVGITRSLTIKAYDPLKKPNWNSYHNNNIKIGTNVVLNISDINFIDTGAIIYIGGIKITLIISSCHFYTPTYVIVAQENANISINDCSISHGTISCNNDGQYLFVNNCSFEKGGLEFISDDHLIENIKVTNSRFSNCTSAVFISEISKNLVIKDCIFQGNTYAVFVFSGTDMKTTSIDNNTFIDNEEGLNVRGENENNKALITNNYILNNRIGLISGGTLNNAYKNIIKNNRIGLLINESSINCKFYQNYFESNDIQVSYKNGGINYLYNTYKYGGNFWSDYVGNDKKFGENQDQKGSDGFGDTPYIVSSNLIDKYPIFIDKVKPVADLGLNESIDEGTSYLFSLEKCSDDQMITKVFWSLYYNNKYYNFTEMEKYFIFDEPSICQVKLIVYDFANNNDSAKKVITILDVRSPKSVCQGNITCTEKSTVWFNGSRSHDTGIISKYEWIFDYKGETRILEGINVSYLFDVPGIVPVTLRVTDSAGHVGEDHFTVTVIDIMDPFVEAGDDISIDNGEMATFNGSLSTDNGLIEEYNWTFYYGGQLILLQEIVASYIFEKPGIYNITLEVSDQFGNKASDSLTLTVRDTIKPSAIITGLSTFLENENVKLSGRSSTDNGDIVNYIWTFEDNGSVSIPGVDLDYKVKVRGYHKIFLTVIDWWGNEATANLTINAVDNSKPFTAAGPDQEVAIGTSVTLNASGSHDDGTITKYQWTFSYDNQNQELLGRIVTFKFDKPGTYEVTLKVYDDSENYGIDAVTITVKSTGVVKGIVLDDRGKPIDGATVEIVASDGKTYTFTTAPDGSFSLVIPPGSFTWKITKSGYETITGSSSVDILGENTLDLAGTPMKKSASSGTSPILFIVPILIILVLIIGVVIFLMVRKKKTAPETMGAKPEDEAIPPEPAEGGAPAETSLPPEASEFVQAPPVMEEDVPVEKVEENTTVDDLLKEPGQ